MWNEAKIAVLRTTRRCFHSPHTCCQSILRSALLRTPTVSFSQPLSSTSATMSGRYACCLALRSCMSVRAQFVEWHTVALRLVPALGVRAPIASVLVC